MNQFAQSFSLRLILSFTLSVSLLLVPSVSLISTDAAQEPSVARKGRPCWTRPEGAFPDLEDIKRESSVRREPAAPIPSTKRSKKNEGKPWDGRRVGEPSGQIASARSRLIRRAHARSLVAQPTFTSLSLSITFLVSLCCATQPPRRVFTGSICCAPVMNRV